MVSVYSTISDGLLIYLLYLQIKSGSKTSTKIFISQLLKTVFFKAEYKKEKNTFLAFTSLCEGLWWMLEIEDPGPC